MCHLSNTSSLFHVVAQGEPLCIHQGPFSSMSLWLRAVALLGDNAGYEAGVGVKQE